MEALLEDKINSGNEANPDDVYGSMTELLDDVMKKEDEMKQEEQTSYHQIDAPVVAQAGPSSFGTVSSRTFTSVPLIFARLQYGELVL